MLAAPTVPSHTTITTSLQSHHQPPVKKDAADIVVGDGRLLGAGGHAERPQEVVDQDVELLDVLGLGLQHAEHHLVPLPHAFGVRGTDVVLDDGFPLSAANPASQETLDLRLQRLANKSYANSAVLSLCICQHAGIFSELPVGSRNVLLLSNRGLQVVKCAVFI